MPETRIRVVNNSGRAKFEMVYFLEVADASVVRNRILKLNIEAFVADPVDYLGEKFCDKAHCPNNGEYLYHGEVKPKDLIKAAKNEIQAHCPDGYEFYEVGIAIQKIGGGNASKEGNIEIKYCPKGAAPAAEGPANNPDKIIVVNIHLKQGSKRDLPRLKTTLDAFSADVRKQAIDHVNTTTLDNFKEHHFGFVLNSDRDSPLNLEAYKAATKAAQEAKAKAALEAEKLALTFANKSNDVHSSQDPGHANNAPVPLS